MTEELKNFYPTPKNLIKKMTDKIVKIREISILEPSAGRGDIIEYIQENKFEILKYYKSENIKEIDCIEKNENLQKILTGKNFRVIADDFLIFDTYKSYDLIIMKSENIKEIDCIEKNENLQKILTGKNFRVIADDFLIFDTYKSYDLIIMNPPFDNGDKHLLKAISLFEKSGGGQIICLLNAETLKNPYSVYRKDLQNKLESLGAEIEFLKDEFKEADRKTNVEVALVNIYKPKRLLSGNLLTGMLEDKYFKKEEKNKDEFKEADRKTNVEVALVNIYKPKRLLSGNLLTGMLEDKYFKKEEKNVEFRTLTFYDQLKNLVARYNYEIEAGINLIREFRTISEFTKSDDDNYSKISLIKGTYSSIDLEENDYIKMIRYKYWKKLFRTISEFTKSDDDNYSKISLIKGTYSSIDLEENDYIKMIRYKYWKKLYYKEELTKLLTNNIRQKYFSDLP